MSTILKPKKLSKAQVASFEKEFSFKLESVRKDTYDYVYVFSYAEEREMFSSTVIDALRSVGRIEELNMVKRTIELWVR